MLTDMFITEQEIISPVPKSIEKEYAFITIRAYCLHSYVYYALDTTIISDAEYDELCKHIEKHFTFFKKYDINDYINYDEIKAGSGYTIPSKICGQTKDYIESVIKTREMNKTE